MTISIWWFFLIGVLAMCNAIGWGIAQRRYDAAVSDLQLLSTRPLTVQELAEKKRVHPSTISKLIRRGKIKAEKVGRQWRIAQGGE